MMIHPSFSVLALSHRGDESAFRTIRELCPVFVCTRYPPSYVLRPEFPHHMFSI